MISNNELISKIKSYNRFLNSKSLNKAFDFAMTAHKNQKRKTGDPFVIHPLAVANILSDLKLDSATIVTGLLHDTIEDTSATYELVLKEFGKEVADLVDGVTKISALEHKVVDNSKAENFRKLILATSKDIRVLLVKLADRLHNMRTIKFLKDNEKQIRKAKETMEIYAPLADRMGMNRIRDELEDLSFSVLNKPARELIIERLNFIKNNKDDTFKSISEELIDLLNRNGIKATITGREKTPFSIWRKIQNKKISLEQLTDIIGFRVIVNSVEDCYKTLGIFHTEFPTIPGKFKDYISTPKINKYKSIHTAVIGPKKSGDVKLEVLELIYEYLISHKYEHRLSFLPIFANMFYAGPREAVHHALIRQRIGFDQFTVGRDHAGAENFYDPKAAPKLLEDVRKQIGIDVFCHMGAKYCQTCNAFVIVGECCHPEDEMRDVAGSHFRDTIVNGQFFEFADKDMQEYVFQHVTNIIET